MSKPGPKIHRDNDGEFCWETYFVGGKQRRRKIRMFDGRMVTDSDEYLRMNADDIWLKQHDEYEILHEREMDRMKSEKEGAGTGKDDELPF